MHSELALEKVLTIPFKTVLDIGSGDGYYANKFKEAGKSVQTISYVPPADYVGDYLDLPVDPVDCIWASHVLEHCPNPNLFLKKTFKDLKKDGTLCVIVPPLKHEIVGGHVSLWNAGILLYNLILAGYDCSEASVKTSGYSISVIVRKREAMIPDLNMDFGDIEKLTNFFPFPAVHGFDGQIEEINW